MRFYLWKHAVAFAIFLLAAGTIHAGDQPQWGERHTRNMVATATGLPVVLDPSLESALRWSTSTSGGSYASPIIAGGKVFVGASNAQPRDPRLTGDRAVMLCLDEQDGSFQWQLAVPRTGGDPYLDWPEVGLCSPPSTEGDRVYTVTNRGEVVSLDLHGMANGNQGPFLDEGRFLTAPGGPEITPADTDADIIWLFDMRSEVGMYPHDAPYVSPLIDGDYLYLNTCNGVDYTHRKIGNPEAPSLIVLNKHTGELIAQEGEGMGHRIFHATWSSPALGEVNGRRLVFFGGPDGVLYAFNALPQGLAPSRDRRLECVWRFDCDPTAPKENIHQYVDNSREGPSTIMGMPVFHDNKVYVTAGGDIWWGKRQSWLKCIDASGTGDVTGTAEIWSYPMDRQSSATPALHDGLVYVTDDGGTLHCVDAATGQAYWTHKVGNRIWGSALVADGKVYVGALNGTLAVFAAGREMNLLHQIRLDDQVNTTLSAANGTVYVAALTRLYAFAQKSAP